MARTAKTPRYNAFNSYVNCFGEKTQNQDRWREYLDDAKPLFLELGCGRAEVTLANARWHPEANFIGVDLKADRLWRPAKTSLEEKLTNTAFIQDNILNIEQYFNEAEVDGIWITFPDPFPKDRQIKHRMFNRNFLDIYKKLLKKEGSIRFKTDNDALFEWVLEYLGEQKDVVIDHIEKDLHASDLSEELKTETTYEKKFRAIGLQTKYLAAHFVS